MRNPKTTLPWRQVVLLACIMLGLAGIGAQETTSTEPADAQTTGAARAAAVGEVIVVKMDDQIINPVTARFIMDAITRGERDNIPVVIELDTPGGLLQSTRELVKRILGSKVPVITFVSPNGSRAASAGVFITMASHVAAMAPGTNIGAAHVVDISGSWPGRRSRSTDDTTTGTTETRPTMREPDPSEEPNVMSEKVMNDTLAWVEGIARLRGRNADWARDAVERSVSVTAAEALKLNVIDLVAENVTELLKQLDGREVTVQGGSFTLRTANATQVAVELTTRQRILNVLANPNIAYILLLAGFAGLAYEVTHPGLIVPGVGGAVCLLLAAFALQMLPTNYAAILLIIAGLGLIIAEIKFQSYGLLTLGGAACLFFGSLALFDQPGPFIGVSLSVIFAVTASTVVVLGFLVLLVIRVHANRPVMGMSSFVGEIAEVAVPLTPEGKVFYNGAYWDAVSQEPVARGAKVRILAMDRLRLLVEPLR
jgi:membrane-bound serine protease (ClpP class)